jgi:TolB-like protein/Flp pilus assembly protein TadD
VRTKSQIVMKARLQGKKGQRMQDKQSGLGGGSVEQNKCPSADNVLHQLSRIVQSAEFDASTRNRRFLTFVVEEALAGRNDRIKAYTIATTVFGRSADFDPQIDPIVRIEAGRLRHAMERYYLTAGRHDPVLITIPKGSYKPAFALRPDAETIQGTADVPPGGESRLAQRNPSIFVGCFERESSDPGRAATMDGFVRHLIVGLARFHNLVVFGPELPVQCGSTSDRGKMLSEVDIDLVLTGGLTLSADKLYAQIVLKEARTGKVLWADSFDSQISPASLYDVRNAMADRVVRAVAHPFGLLQSYRTQLADSLPPDRWLPQHSVDQFYKYWRSYRRDMHEPVRALLEKAIQVAPDYAEAYACKALIYVDAYRFGYAADFPIAVDPRAKAYALAERALELAPRSSRGYHALGLAQWFGGETEVALATLERGLSLNPNDTEIMAELGFRQCQFANWDIGVALLERSYAENPRQPGTYRTQLAKYHYINGRYREALSEARRVGAPQVVYGFIWEAMAAAKLGLREDASAAIRRILAIDPAYGEHLVDDLRKRNVDPVSIELMVEGLSHAGLPISHDEPSVVSSQLLDRVTRRKRP